MKAISLPIALLLSLSFNTQAALHTLQSTWQGWDPSLPNPYQSVGIFTFTYDDSTPAINLTPPQPNGYTVDHYSNAITQASFIFENRSFYLSNETSNGISIAANKQSGGGDIYMNMTFRDQSNVMYLAKFNIELYADFSDTSLNNMIGVKANENGSFIYDPTKPRNAGHEAVAMKTSFSEVPVPAAGWLFGAGLAGLISTARRLKHKRSAQA
jgi:hypothetical protein